MTFEINIAILFIFLLLVFIFVLAVVIRYRKRLIENRALRSEFESALLQSNLEIREQTLKHISYELHDNFGQVASLIKINLTTLSFDDTEKAVEKIAQIKDLVAQLIYDLKALSVSLGTSHISDLGLIGALQKEIERLNSTGCFVAVLGVKGIIPDFANDITVILFRMLQEILNNAMKHIGASTIEVTVEHEENTLTFRIRDDGKGFDSKIASERKGAGLINLNERAKLIKASLKIDSVPQQGTTVLIRLNT